MRFQKIILLTMLVLPTACGTMLESNQYSSERSNEMSARILMGTVTGAESVSVDGGDQSGTLAGGVGGAAAGGLLGAALGSGSNSTGTGALIGAALGGLGGAAVGKHAGAKHNAWRIFVRTDAGEEIAVVHKERLYKGTRVRIEVPLSGGRARLHPVG